MAADLRYAKYVRPQDVGRIARFKHVPQGQCIHVTVVDTDNGTVSGPVNYVSLRALKRDKPTDYVRVHGTAVSAVEFFMQCEKLKVFQAADKALKTQAKK